MAIIRPNFEHVIKIYGSTLPAHGYMLNNANSHNGWVKFSSRLYELMSKFKCHNYPELYQDERRMQTALFRALCESDDQIIKLWNKLESCSEKEQSQYIDEFIENSNKLGQLIDESLIHIDDMDWSPATPS